jgi:hypothetical protein
VYLKGKLLSEEGIVESSEGKDAREGRKNKGGMR